MINRLCNATIYIGLGPFFSKYFGFLCHSATVPYMPSLSNNKHVYDLNLHLDFHLWFDTSLNFRLLLFALFALTNHDKWLCWNEKGMSILLIGKVKCHHSCTSVEEIINSFLLLQITFSDMKHESA
jgi:hypothetical protein